MSTTTRRTRQPTARLLGCGLLLAVASAACSTDPGQSRTSPPPTGADGAPPTNAWALASDGSPTAGEQALTFSGAHDLDGEAATFDGSTGFAATNAPGPVATDESFSVAAWVSLAEPPVAGGADFATAVSQVGDQAAAFFLGVGEGSWAFSVKDDDTNQPGHTVRAMSEPAVPRPDTWVHLVGVYDGQDGEIRLYLDGQPAAEAASTSPWQAQGALTVGRAQAYGVAADFWPGAVSDVRVYDTVLTDGHVRALVEETRPDAAPPAPPAAPETGSTVAPCPNPEGGLCLGDLEPGSYRTQVFTPGITYTVPSGWTNGEDLPGNFLLHRRQDSQDGMLGGSYLGIYQNVRAAAVNCAEARQKGVGATPVELVRWYRSVPGLAVSPATEVEVGGLRGLQIDLSLDPGKQVCRYGPYQGVPLIIGNGTSQLHHVIFKKLAVRLVILDWRRGNVTLEITSVESQHTPAEFRALLRPIIESLRFRA